MRGVRRTGGRILPGVREQSFQRRRPCPFR
jgi:hypothetical protein